MCLAEVYANLGDYAKALAARREALSLVVKLRGGTIGRRQMPGLRLSISNACNSLAPNNANSSPKHNDSAVGLIGGANQRRRLSQPGRR